MDDTTEAQTITTAVANITTANANHSHSKAVYKKALHDIIDRASTPQSITANVAVQIATDALAAGAELDPESVS